jgi:hypothetical protein
MSDFENRNETGTPEQRARNGQREKAAQFFKERETRKSAIYQQMETERVLGDAKTAKLRALRLAKEEADREAALNAPPAVKAKKKTPLA